MACRSTTTVEDCLSVAKATKGLQRSSEPRKQVRADRDHTIHAVTLSEVCEVQPQLRKECGYPGITVTECNNRGCCFDSRTSNVIWCFKPAAGDTHFLYRSNRTPINMSIEVITIDQRNVSYRVVSMPGDGTCLFHSLCYILHGHIRLTLDIRRNIVSYVLNDWDRFEVWTDDSTGDNYTTQEHYKSEMLKPFTYGSACELMAAAELFSCRFQVYRNG
ncbi:TFF3 factor, partial [Polypterus senegalus]